MNVISNSLMGRVHNIKGLFHFSIRRNHSKSYCVELLTKRNIIQVTGDNVSDFLQVLITNDMKRFTDKVNSIYALFLNSKGRVLFDTIIYSCTKPNTYLLESDVSCVSSLVKHLTLYKIKKKVQIISLENKLNIWSVYNPEAIEHSFSMSSAESGTQVMEEQNHEVDISKVSENVIISKDPRVSDLGYRVIAGKDEDIPLLFNVKKGMQYEINRYKLGIPEGSDEIIKGQSFPLECNADYLNGISFDKGCYIGQELTARTHHTGVVRKRLMPLVFENTPAGIPVHSPIEDPTVERKSPIGKLISYKGTYGLGLMRVKETLESKSIKVLDVLCRCYQPCWWHPNLIKPQHLKVQK